MELEFIKDKLKKSNLTSESLFLLYLLYNDPVYYNQYVSLKYFSINLVNCLHLLTIHGYIQIIGDDLKNPSSFLLIKKYDEVFKEDSLSYSYLYNPDLDKLWEEFISLYPKKSGDRPLHNNKERCKAKYSIIIKKYPHENIIKGLKKEIEIREKYKLMNKFIPEWKLLSSYINQKGWEPFLEIDDTNEDEQINNGRINKIL